VIAAANDHLKIVFLDQTGQPVVAFSA